MPYIAVVGDQNDLTDTYTAYYTYGLNFVQA